MTKQLIPYVTAGYPSKSATLDLLKACAAGGADQVELGIPFSDPLADGPVIQQASHQAIARGMTPREAISIAGRFKEIPVLLMTYCNPVLQMPDFFKRAAAARVAGVVIPDLPPESAMKDTHGIPLIPLCAPTCSDDRLRRIGRGARSFIYIVSRAGVTGESGDLSRTAGFVRRARRLTRKPLMVGFGISTPEQARDVARISDGIIVGSAVVRRSRSPREVERFVASLRKAVDVG